jgi:hypothetical protein
MNISPNTPLPPYGADNPQLRETLSEIELLLQHKAEGRQIDPARAAELQMRLAAAMGSLRPEALGYFSSLGVDVPEAQSQAPVAATAGAMGEAQVQLSADIDAFMRLFYQVMQEARKSAREQRGAELQSQASAVEGQAKEMRTAAEQRFTAAVTEAAFQIASGAVSAAAAGMSLSVLCSVPSSQLTPNSPMMTTLNSYNQLASGSSQVIGGAGKMAGAYYNMEAGYTDARGKQLEAEGLKAGARRDTANQIFQAANDLLKDIREKLAAIAQSNIETNRGMARNI